jgi:GxxExxY protein
MDVINELAEEVFSILKSGLTERVYHNAMEVQLRERGIPYETERIIPITFKEHVVGFVRADLLVNKTIVVELKSVAKLKQEHVDQCGRYMKLLGYPEGIVINFPDSGTKIEVCEIALPTDSLPTTPLLDIQDI